MDDIESQQQTQTKHSTRHKLVKLVAHEPLLSATIFGVLLGVLAGSLIRLGKPSSKAIDLVGRSWWNMAELKRCYMSCCLLQCMCISQNQLLLHMVIQQQFLPFLAFLSTCHSVCSVDIVSIIEALCAIIIGNNVTSGAHTHILLLEAEKLMRLLQDFLGRSCSDC